MRLFAAIDIPDEIRHAIQNTIALLKPSAPLRWSRAANLHITTKFLGEVDAALLPAVEQALAAVPSPGEIPIIIRGFGWFPNPHAPRILYIGIQAPQALSVLHRATDQALLPLGIPAETKPYRPHLTIARIEPKTPLVELRHAIAAQPTNDFGSFTATDFYLYESKTLPSGSVYTKRARVSL